MTSRRPGCTLSVVLALTGVLWWGTGLARVVHFHQEQCGHCQACQTLGTASCCPPSDHDGNTSPCRPHGPKHRHNEHDCSLCQHLSAVKAPVLAPPGELCPLGPAPEPVPAAATDAPRVEPPLSLGSRDPPVSLV